MGGGGEGRGGVGGGGGGGGGRDKGVAAFLYTQVRQLRVVTGPPCSRVPCEGRRLLVPCYR